MSTSRETCVTAGYSSVNAVQARSTALLPREKARCLYPQSAAQQQLAAYHASKQETRQTRNTYRGCKSAANGQTTRTNAVNDAARQSSSTTAAEQSTTVTHMPCLRKSRHKRTYATHTHVGCGYSQSLRVRLHTHPAPKTALAFLRDQSDALGWIGCTKHGGVATIFSKQRRCRAHGTCCSH